MAFRLTPKKDGMIWSPTSAPAQQPGSGGSTRLLVGIRSANSRESRTTVLRAPHALTMSRAKPIAE